MSSPGNAVPAGLALEAPSIVVKRHNSLFPHQFTVATPEVKAQQEGPFRCFACDKVRPADKYRGQIAGEKICFACFPYQDEATVSHQKRFDRFYR